MVPRENMKFIAVGKACVTAVDEVVTSCRSKQEHNEGPSLCRR